MGRTAGLLEHRGECTGRWRVSTRENVIACRRCGAEYACSDERRFAVSFENLMGMKLRELAFTGHAILRSERGPAGPEGGRAR
jgi:hypothetical protein